MTVKDADATSTGSDEAATAEPTFDRRGLMVLGAGGLLAAVLQGARPAGVARDELTLAWPESAGFFKRKAEDPANKETIARVIRAVTGSSLRLAFELRDEAALAAEAPVTPQLSEEELVNRFVEEFDAEVLPPEEEST